MYTSGASSGGNIQLTWIERTGKPGGTGVPKPLFEVRQPAQFDVSKDGRFLIHVPVDQATTSVPLTVVVNWQAALRK